MKGIKGVATEVGDSMLTLSNMITNVFLKIGSYLRIIKIQIMLFFLRTNRYVTTLITNIANALTQDTATKEEITTFQDQTQKFITILLTWFFVYNWYYIVFFLEDEDNVRYEINATYWVKLPKPTFGAHFIKLKSDSDPKSVQGVQVIAVIKGSPAENAGVQKNDSITSVSGKLVKNPDDLINAIKKNKGKSIELGYIRNGKQSEVSVKL